MFPYLPKNVKRGKPEFYWPSVLPVQWILVFDSHIERLPLWGSVPITGSFGKC